MKDPGDKDLRGQSSQCPRVVSLVFTWTCALTLAMAWLSGSKTVGVLTSDSDCYC